MVRSDAPPEQLAQEAQATVFVPANAAPEWVDNGWETFAPADPFSPGSPEANFVRRHTRYFVDNKGVVRLGVSFFLRLICNTAVILSVPVLIGLVIGWLLGWSWALDRSGTPKGVDIDAGDLSTWWTVVGVVVVAAFLLWQILPVRDGSKKGIVRWLRRWASVTFLVVLVTGGAIPLCVVYAWNTADPKKAQDVLPILGVVFLGLGVIAVAAILGFLISKFSRHGALRSAGCSAADRGCVTRRGLRSYWGRSPFAARALVRDRSWRGAARVRDNGGSVAERVAIGRRWGIRSVRLLRRFSVAAYGAGPNAWALHGPYRERLFTCFGVLRQRNILHGNEFRASARHPKCEPLLSQSHDACMPDLLICATANISDAGAAPAGSHGLPYVFGPDRVEVSGEEGASFSTSDFEKALAQGLLAKVPMTLPAAVAVTGAAVAPAMGKMTRTPYRALMTMFNLRLGLWLPNPLNESMRAEGRASS